MRRKLLAIALPITLAGCAGDQLSDLQSGPRPVSHTGQVQGIDVSKFQGDIDWHAVRASGVKFAFIKATEGGDRFDHKFNENWKGAKKAGVARGAYHFYYFCRPAADQVAWFIRHVPKEPGALPPVLDMEWNGHSPTCTKKPPRDKVLSEMRVFLAAAERHYGQKPIIYSSVDFHREILEGQFRDHPFWLRSVAGHPDTKYRGRKNWVFWQYTGTGTVAGIEGDVDRNVFYASSTKWKKWKEGVTAKPVAAKQDDR